MSDQKEEPKRISKTFKTSWGHEYTLMLSAEEKPDVTKYNSPTLQPTIDDLIEKSRKEKPANKKK